MGVKRLKDNTQLPAAIVAEFFISPGDPVRMVDLGLNCLEEVGYPLSKSDNTLKIALEQKLSNAGNIYYQYVQNAVPLPSGLASLIKIEGFFIPLNKSGFSEKQYPFREGKAEIFVGKQSYIANLYISKTKSPYYIKILVHKKPDRSQALTKPRGGAFL